MEDLNEILDIAYEQAEAAKRNEQLAKDPLRSFFCPNCKAGTYYWMESSGRCTGCGFHWGIDKAAA